MSQYRYLGTNSVMVTPDRTHSLSVFGEVIELPDDVAEQMVLERAPLLPEELWKKCGISDEEAAENPSVISHDLAGEQFIARRNSVWQALFDFHTQLEEKAAKVTAVPPAPPQVPTQVPAVQTASVPVPQRAPDPLVVPIAVPPVKENV